MYRKIIKNKKDLHLPMTLTYRQFHTLSPEDKKKYILDDGVHFQYLLSIDECFKGYAEHHPKTIEEAHHAPDHSDGFKLGTSEEMREYMNNKTKKQ